MTLYDAIVIGGCLVGSAIAHGLAREGAASCFSTKAIAYRASRSTFGLVWV
jgi:hydrogen cyanide synthase HcnC